MAVDTSVGNIKDIQAVTTTTIVTDIQSLSPSALIELFVLDMSQSTGVVNNFLYFHAGTNQVSGDIVWQGNTYIHLPIEAEGFSAGSNGSLPRPKIRLANIDGAFSQTLANYDDLIGCKISRKRTFAKYLDAVNFYKKNLLTYTEQLEASVWGIAGCAVGKDLIQAPDGSLTGDKLYETPSTVAVYHYVDFVGFPARGITLNDLNVYSRSFYIKGAERTKVYIQIYSNPTTSSNVSVVFDTATGLFTSESKTGTASNHTFAATADVNGWWRVSQTYDLNTTDADMYIRLMLISTGVTTNYIGVAGSGVYLWGNQLELGVLTNYVPSMPVFVSRASVAGYIGSNGFIQTAAIDAPRYSYNPANLSAAPKLLVEAASINYALNSSVASTLTLGVGTHTAPDGNLCKSLITNNGASLNYSSIGASAIQTVSLATGASTDRCFVGYFATKASNPLGCNPDITMTFATAGTTVNNIYSECRVDIAAGTMVTLYSSAQLVELYKSIELAPCGMYKVTCIVRFTQGATILNNFSFGIQVRTASGNVGVFTGDGVSGFEYSHLQWENSNIPSSYIPTTAVAVQRSADVSIAETGYNLTANPNQYYPDDVWYIDQKMSETRYMIEWELASAFDLIGVMLPSRQVNQNSCPWKYGGAECGFNQNAVGAKLFDSTDVAVFSTAADVCGKRLSSCEARFGTTKTVVLPYGGFPGALQYG